MPIFQAIPPIGFGAGAAAAGEGLQEQQQKQQDLLATLYMHAQQIQAQQAQTQAYKQAMTQIAQENADTRRSAQRSAMFQRIAPGTEVSPDLAQTPEAAGQVEEQQTLPSRQMAGFQPMPGTQAGQGTAAGESQVQTMASPSRPTGRFLKIPSDVDVQREQALEARRQALEAAARDRERGLDLRAQGLRDRENKQPQPHFTPVPLYDEQGRPTGAGSFNTLTGGMTMLPTPGGAAIRPAPGAAQLAQQTAKKKDALDTLDQLDQSIEAAKQYLGPGAGRVTNVNQLVGFADPKVQALGTKMLIAKMKVDASLGGMRAAASPQILARWDNLLANKVTPEGLHASVQAMREILGGKTPAIGGNDIRAGGTYQGRKILQVEPVP